MPSFGLAHPRGRFRFDRLTAAALARIARFPSYRAPRAADLHDASTFQPPAGPSDEPVMSGRAFIASGSTRPDVRLVAVQPFMGELAACPHLATLRRLDLTGNRIGPDGARALAASPHLGGLWELGLNGNSIGDDGAAALAAAPWLAGLERLDVAGDSLTAEAVARLLDAAPRVTAVDVSGNAANVADLFRNGMREVVAAGSGLVGRVESSRPDGGADGVRGETCRTGPADSSCRWQESLSGLEDSTRPTSHEPVALESLDLRHTHGALAVLGYGPFRVLTHLDLGFTDCGDAFDPAAFPALRTLGLRGCRLTNPTLRSTTVETLDLSVNPLADPAAAVAGCPAITHLNLANTGLTDAALVHVLVALPRLRSLDLAWNPLNAAAVDAQVARLGFTGRLSVDLTGTRGRAADRR